MLGPDDPLSFSVVP